MNQDQFCEGVRLLGGRKSAAQLLAINERAIERIMNGQETLGDRLAHRLAESVADLERRCRDWSTQPGLF
ncbi:hypothetical protein VH570_14550 [Sphingobium sp. HT1-2]|uniref:hypothetical protein n=1 Tax=Sphingobium sp. HT1-2 TaxID=3111640 RepID=UPI003BFFEF18